MEKQEYKGYTIELMIDETPQDPREWSNLGTMLCFHKTYNLGDDVGISSDEFSSWDEVKDYIKQIDGILITPLYLYDHTVLRMKTGQFQSLPQGHKRFDTMPVGFIYTTEERIKEMFGTDKITDEDLEHAKKVLENEVNIYDKYISGQVYGFQITNPDGGYEDSCWGFYDPSNALQEAQGIIGYQVKQKKKKKLNKLKSLIKYNVPLEKRTQILRRY